MDALASVYKMWGKPMQKVAKQNESQDIGVLKAIQSISLVIIGTSGFGSSTGAGAGAGAEKTPTSLRLRITARGREVLIYMVLNSFAVGGSSMIQVGYRPDIEKELSIQLWAF